VSQSLRERILYSWAQTLLFFGLNARALQS